MFDFPTHFDFFNSLVRDATHFVQALPELVVVAAGFVAVLPTFRQVT